MPRPRPQDVLFATLGLVLIVLMAFDIRVVVLALLGAFACGAIYVFAGMMPDRTESFWQRIFISGFLAVVMSSLILILPGLYLMIVFGASLTGVVIFERAGIGRTFSLVNPAFGQTLGRLLSFALAVIVYSAIVNFIVSALVGREGFVYQLLSNILSLPVSFAFVGVGIVTYATLRNRENPAVTAPTLAAELDRMF